MLRPDASDSEESPDPSDPTDPAVDGEMTPEPTPGAAGATPWGEDGELAPPRRRRYPSTLGGVFYLLVLAVSAVALVVVFAGDWRVGVRMLAGALGAAGVLRLALPQHEAGMLAVRSKWIDVVLVIGVGAVLWWLAGSIPDQPA